MQLITVLQGDTFLQLVITLLACVFGTFLKYRELGVIVYSCCQISWDEDYVQIFKLVL
jgi:hypothetical protein